MLHLAENRPGLGAATAYWVQKTPKGICSAYKTNHSSLFLRRWPENLTSLSSFQATSPFLPIFPVRQKCQTHFYSDGLEANAS